MTFIIVFVSFFWAATAFAAPSVSSVKTYFLRGDYAQTARTCEQIIAQSGGNGSRGMDEVHYFAGLSYFKEGRFDLAGKHFQSVVKDFPSSPFGREAQIGIADLRYAQGECKEAARMYESLLKKNAYRDFKPALYARLRLTALKEGDASGAQKNASRLAAHYPQSPEYRRMTGSTPDVELPGKQSDGVYYVQVGAFGSKQNAERLKRTLMSAGYQVRIEQGEVQGHRSYKVRVGGVSARSQAEALKQELSLQGYPTTICQ